MRDAPSLRPEGPDLLTASPGRRLPSGAFRRLSGLIGGSGKGIPSGALVAFLILAALFLWALLPQRLTGIDPLTQHARLVLSPPLTAGHFLGCDFLGRDLWSRLVTGSLVSLTVGVSVGVLSTVLGCLWGIVSGFLGHPWDPVMMRTLEIWYALPEILIATILMLVLGHGLLAVIVALSIGGWMGVARVLRSETLRLKDAVFMDAARASGVGPFRLVLRHFLPNVLPVILVMFLFRIPGGILGESTLSFLGLGLAPPVASWGVLVNEGWKALPVSAFMLIWPAGFIVLSLVSFQVLADRLARHIGVSR
ncbi:MAG: ABC transporter permease [Nitrospiraceae bacterium]|nr:ABC transporter permease [Nitrospiraceae bacterium]